MLSEISTPAKILTLQKSHSKVQYELFFAGVTGEVNYATKMADRQQSPVACVFVLSLISMILCVFVCTKVEE